MVCSRLFVEESTFVLFGEIFPQRTEGKREGAREMNIALTDGPVGRKLALFSIPMLLSNLLQQLYNAADAVIVGRLIGGDALAAVGASHPIASLLIAMMYGLGAGAEILIAREIGRGDQKAAKQTLDTMMVTILALSVATLAGGVFGSHYLLKLMGTPTEILNEATGYLQVYFLGMIGVAGYNTLNGFIRSIGNSIVPLVVLILSTVLNVLLDLILVGPFHMGVTGAALATVIAQSFSFLCCLIYVNTKKDMISCSIFHPDFRWNIVSEGFACGVPYALQQAANSIGALLLQTVVNSLGTQVVTAYTVGSKIDAFAGLPMVGLSQSLGIFTSQNLGAGKPERAEKGRRTSIVYAYCVCLVLLVLFWTCAEQITSLFCQDPEVIRMAADYIRILSCAYFFASYWVVVHGFIRGTKDMLPPTIINMIGNWGARLPLAVLLKKYYGVLGVWLSIPCGWVLAFLMTWVYLRSKHFRRKYELQLQTEGGALDNAVE